MFSFHENKLSLSLSLKWFSKLMGEEPDLDPEINREFFENNILQLDPCLMTESGIRWVAQRVFHITRWNWESNCSVVDVFLESKLE